MQKEILEQKEKYHAEQAKKKKNCNIRYLGIEHGGRWYKKKHIYMCVYMYTYIYMTRSHAVQQKLT